MTSNQFLMGVFAVAVVFYFGFRIGNDRDVSGTGMHIMDNGSVMSDTSMESMMQMMGSQLKGRTGADLDRAFLSMMIPHHQGAVEMCRPVLTGAQHEELKGLCRNIIESQTREIEQMKAWQSLWFGR